MYFTVNALFLIFTRPMSGKLYDKKKLSTIMYPALLFSIIEALLIAHASALWMIILAAIFKAFGQGTAQPALQAECFHKLGSQKKDLLFVLLKENNKHIESGMVYTAIHSGNIHI